MKERLDVLLVNKNLASSYKKAKAIIMAGHVFVNGQREIKAGTLFKDTAKIEVRGKPPKYVSRGGLKLEKAIEVFGIDLQDKVCMDVGSSTGGFTDCMLQEGAKKVYAIDVGTNQLAWKLRSDDRVVTMEKTNIRYVKPKDIGEPIDFSSIDVAFISLELVLVPVRNILIDNGQVVCLIKPQFEAEREQVGEKGVVRDSNIHIEVIEKIIKFAISVGFNIVNLDYSPITGPEGNIEYLLHLQKSENSLASNENANKITIEDCDKYVNNAYINNISQYIREIVDISHVSLSL